ncbi:hypothetical protein [Pseudaestuariivita rosea]|uniref:hypothetical protein n=1 Tax=Pseudaestuariivita rosea TaxID=2763263 RepID=UPI001ABA4E99|nr:hypothetical protein [Pseudaestuariivita rosea]
MRQFVGQDQFVALQCGDLFLISRNDGWVLRFHNPVQQAVQLFVDLCDVALENILLRSSLGAALAPGVLEHHADKPQDFA